VATLGRLLQLFGLIIVPMALWYYFLNRGMESEAKLMFGELTILALGATAFILGTSLIRKSS
jgi:hypothetical protein